MHAELWNVPLRQPGQKKSKRRLRTKTQNNEPSEWRNREPFLLSLTAAKGSTYHLERTSQMRMKRAKKNDT